MADVPFTDKTYYLDTSEPQLVDLLTPAEAERCVPIFSCFQLYFQLFSETSCGSELGIG